MEEIKRGHRSKAKERKNGVLRHFQQLKSYRDKIEIQNRGKFPSLHE